MSNPTTENDYPNDSDGAALRMMAANGINMLQTMVLEFAIAVEGEAESAMVVDRLNLSGLGDSVSTYYDEGELEEGEIMSESNKQFWPSWTVYVKKEMIPSYVDVIDLQKKLEMICQGLGHLDGWNAEV